MTRHTLFSGAVALHDTVLEDERHLRNLLLTKKQDHPHHSEESQEWATSPGFEVILT